MKKLLKSFVKLALTRGGIALSYNIQHFQASDLRKTPSNKNIFRAYSGIVHILRYTFSGLDLNFEMAITLRPLPPLHSSLKREGGGGR